MAPAATAGTGGFAGGCIATEGGGGGGGTISAFGGGGSIGRGAKE